MSNEKIPQVPDNKITVLPGFPKVPQEGTGPELAEDFVECPLEEPKEVKYLTEIEECEKHIGGVE